MLPDLLCTSVSSTAKSSPLAWPHVPHCCFDASRSKPEVESLVAFVGGRLQVMNSLLSTHCVPELVTLVVLDNVVSFREDEDTDIPCEYAQQDLVSAVVERRVICSVYLRGDDGREPVLWLALQRNSNAQSVERTYCTAILYSEEPTVRVRTDPALRDVKPTSMACTYG